MTTNLTSERFAALLEKAKANLSKSQQATIDQLSTNIKAAEITHVNLENIGIKHSELERGSESATEAAIDAIKSIASNIGAATQQEQCEPRNSDAPLHHSKLGVARDDIILNRLQQEFHDSVVAGEDVVLIGAAGTGKTTSVRQTTKSLVTSDRLPRMRVPTKWLRVDTPGAAIVSYTRKAVNNIRHAAVDEFKNNVITLHKLLEFEPVFYDVEDKETGEWKKTMQFIPARNETNPLPVELVLIIFEESSMIPVELYAMLEKAMPHPHQEVLLGDIQQLPPTFGMSILGFKMLSTKIIELTDVYRQALGSPIINLAWKILGGNSLDFAPMTKSVKVWNANANAEVTRQVVIALDKLAISNDLGTVVFQIWQKTLKEDTACFTAIKQFNVWADQVYYNPQEDMILCPYNKALGTVELNKGIMQHLGKKRGAIVHEVIAGFNKYYLAVGDRVLYDKEDAFIVSINNNGSYLGETPQPASENLDRWGHRQKDMTDEEKLIASEEAANFSLEAIEQFMESAAANIDNRVCAASHSITLRYAMTDESVTISDAAQVNALLGGYAITVYKSQGSEWVKVFILTHASHSAMVSRELLYTAVTRAKKFLHIICEKDAFYKGVRSQRIKGNTLKEKAEFFKGKISQGSGNGDTIEELVRKNGGEFDPMRYSAMNATGRNEQRWPETSEEMEDETRAADARSSDSIGTVAVSAVSDSVLNDSAAITEAKEAAQEFVAAAKVALLDSDRLALLEAAKRKLMELKARKGLR